MSSKSRAEWHLGALRVQWSVVVPLVAVALIGGFYLGRGNPPLLSQQPLDVSCLIESVKAELVAAENSQLQRNEAALFQLKEFEMEINYVVGRSGGVKAEVVGVGSNLGSSSERVQKLRLKWDAIQNKTEGITASLTIDQDAAGAGTIARPVHAGPGSTDCGSSKEMP